MNYIRKVSIGLDPTKGGLHFVVGQKLTILNREVKIISIKDDEKGGVNVYYHDGEVVKHWKSFNANMPITREYDTSFGNESSF